MKETGRGSNLSDSDDRPRLSIVVPAYNEQTRLPASLDAIQRYLARQPQSWEVVVVDDGSEDRTAEVVEERQSATPHLRLVRNPHQGKASAVRSGVLASRGEIIFFCDADLSMPIEEISKFLPLVERGYSVVIGSREAPGARRYGEPPYRHFMGRIYNRLVRAVVLGDFHDTQCGFKCFTRAAALDIFPRLQVRTDGATIRGPMVTGFDVEILYLARKLGYRVTEVGVDWYYTPGTKVNPARDTFLMLFDLLKVRVNDRRGVYDAMGEIASEATSG